MKAASPREGKHAGENRRRIHEWKDLSLVLLLEVIETSTQNLHLDGIVLGVFQERETHKHTHTHGGIIRRTLNTAKVFDQHRRLTLISNLRALRDGGTASESLSLCICVKHPSERQQQQEGKYQSSRSRRGKDKASLRDPSSIPREKLRPGE